MVASYLTQFQKEEWLKLLCFKAKAHFDKFSKQNTKIGHQSRVIGQHLVTVYLDEYGTMFSGYAFIANHQSNEILRVYGSMAKASEVVGVSSLSVCDAAKGICIHAAGFKWKYADEYIKNNEL